MLAALRSGRTSFSDIRDTTHSKQDAFVIDPQRFVAAQTSRRGGKSTGLGYRFFRTMAKYDGCFCPYIALTRESAKNIMWEALQEIDEKHKLGAKFTDSNLTVTLPNGSRLQLFGADMKNFIRRLRGIKTPGAGIDEAQDFGSHLESLVDDVLTPALADYSDGWLALTGTPGPVLSGYFYEATEGKRHGYSLHKWTLFDNPYLPNARRFVDELKLKKAWASDNPTLRREYYNKWVLDLEALVFRYQPELNHFSDTPRLNRYVIGVDLGFNDADAIAVIGWDEHVRQAYLVKEVVQAQQGITELAESIESLIKEFNPDKVVMDTGGLGKKVAEEIRRRYQLPILAAEKTRKYEYIELLNDAMRTKRFSAKRDSRFAEDAARVKWDYEKSTPDRMVVSDHFHSDITDAVLYAFREALHWLSEPEIFKPKPGSAELFKAQEDEVIARLEQGIAEQREQDFFSSDPWEL
jgi:hypothetical protein